MRDLASLTHGVFFAVLWGLLTVSPHAALGQEEGSSSSNIKAEASPIARAIEALGEASFAARRQAEALLTSGEQDAYDALMEAKDHPNPEIRLAVRDLLDRQRILWTRPNDSPQVTQLLSHYGDLASADRWVIIQRLAALESLIDRTVLARVARYEPSNSLSQQAALRLCEVLPPSRDSILATEAEIDATSTTSVRPAWSQALERELQGGEREALHWIRIQLRWQVDPRTAAQQARNQAEARWKRALGSPTTSRADRRIDVSLLRWAIDLSMAAGESDAFAMVDRFDDLLVDDHVALREQMDWLARHERWLDMTAWGHRHSDRMHQFPETTLRVAEAWHRLGNPEQAATAIQVAMVAFPKGFEDLETLAHSLAHQGYRDTAYELLQQAQKRTSPGSPERLRMATDLALWDRKSHRESAAAARLDEILTEYETLTDAPLLVTDQDLDRVRSLRSGLLAESEARAVGQWTKLEGEARQRYLAHLETAYQLAEDSSPWLELAVEASEAWQDATLSTWQTRRDSHLAATQKRIEEYRHRLHASPSPTLRFRYEQALSQQQFALADLLLCSTSTRTAGIQLLESLTSDRLAASQAWQRLAQVREAAGDQEGALVATRQALRIQSGSFPSFANDTSSPNASEARSTAGNSEPPRR